jgi:hypothetical protein
LNSEVHKELLRNDPDCAITIYSLRILIKQGKIPSVHIGRKTLVDYDEVIRYFKETGVFHPDKPSNDSVVYGIRKVL